MHYVEDVEDESKNEEKPDSEDTWDKAFDEMAKEDIPGVEEKVDEDELAVPDVPVADFGGRPPRVMRAPPTPSRQEVLEHRVLHCPFRAWCPECVAGKSKCAPHMSSGKEYMSK